ncbi:MAG: hypothetical protein KDK04_28545, partial [Candidatus Competibacteraceae bacterium]|nr:hypothetical protein [Candidatus Competibacteraceae bacterium]
FWTITQGHKVIRIDFFDHVRVPCAKFVAQHQRSVQIRPVHDGDSVVLLGMAPDCPRFAWLVDNPKHWVFLGHRTASLRRGYYLDLFGDQSNHPITVNSHNLMPQASPQVCLPVGFWALRLP